MSKKDKKRKKEKKPQPSRFLLPNETLHHGFLEGMIRGEPYRYHNGLVEIMGGLLTDPNFSLKDKLWVVPLYNVPYYPADTYIWDITRKPGARECAPPLPLTNVRWEKGAAGQLVALYADNPVWPGGFPWPPEVVILYDGTTGKLIAYYPILADMTGELTIEWNKAGVIGIA